MALTKMDRCDRCGAEALVSVSNTPNHVPGLFFCGHHFVEHWAALMLQGWETVDDKREALRVAELTNAGGDAL